MGIRSKLLLTTLIMVLSVLLVLTVPYPMLVSLLKAVMVDSPEAGLNALAQAGAERVGNALRAGAAPALISQAALALPRKPDQVIYVVDAQQRVWVDSADPSREGSHLPAPHALTEGDWPKVFAPVLGPDGQLWGYFVAAANPTVRQERFFNIRTAFDVTIFAIPIFLPFLLFGYHVIRPIAPLRAAVDRMSRGDLDVRIDLGRRRDELGALGRDLNRMAESLQEARRRLTLADQSRRYMVAAVSHDLRTPLMVMLNHVEAIRQDVVADPRSSLQVIHDQGFLLARLIDDLFQLSALDAGQVAWQTEPVNLAELARRAVIAMLPDLERSGFAVEAEIPEAPVWVPGVPGKLERVLNNLLENAHKYGAAGRWLAVRLTCEANLARLEVADLGPGIPPELREKIFDRFFRPDEARTSRLGGAGLGLAIAKEIVLRHGGRIGVRPGNEGTGATFWVELPTCGGTA